MQKKKKKLYLQAKKRFLKKIVGNGIRPRLAVFKSHKHIYAQLIDDTQSITLTFSSTQNKEIKENSQNLSPKEKAVLVGKDLAKKAIFKNIRSVIFDRSSRPYLGRIQSLAEGARKEGLIF